VTVTEDQQLGHPLGVPAQPVSPATAREAINEMLEAGLLDEVMDRVDHDGLALTGVGGFCRSWSRRCSSAAWRPS
jgi:putative transposase